MKKLATPAVDVLLGYTRRVLHLHDGHTLAVFSFAGSAPANWMFLIDSRTLESRRIPIPSNDYASHGAALGADGDIYILPYGNGRGYRYRVKDERFEPIATGLENGEYTWEAFGASNGRIYFGTYPNAILGEYDPATGKCTLLRQIAPDAKYVVSFSEDESGRILCKAWGPRDDWRLFDPTTGQLAPAVPPPSASPGPLGERGGTVRVDPATGTLWDRSDPKRPRRCGETKRPAEPWFLERVGDARIGIGHFGALFRYEPRTGRFTTGRLDNRAPGGNPVMFVAAVTPRCVVGGNYSQQNLFALDPETGRVKSSEAMIARVTGEAMCAVGHGGKAYLGIYVHALLSVYDPKKPLAPGKNPKELAELNSKYGQTRPRAAVSDGKRVWIACEGDYGRLGGVLASIDPQTERVDVFDRVVPDQNLNSLAWEPTSGLLWGGADRWGQMRSHPPTKPTAVLYAFDPETEAVTKALAPWPGADTVTVLGAACGRVAATDGKELLVLDGATGKTLWRGVPTIGLPGKTVTGFDGWGYTLAGGVLYRTDLSSRDAWTAVADAPGCVHLTEPSPGVWIVSDNISLYRIQLTLGSRP